MPVNAEREAYAVQIRADLAAELEVWQKDFCRWLAIQPRTIPNERQALAASALANREVTVDEVKTLKNRRAWRRMWTTLRAENDEKIAEARAEMLDGLPSAVKLHNKAIRSLSDAETVDARAVPPLTVPMLDRAWPKTEKLEIKAPKVFNIQEWLLRDLRPGEDPSAKLKAFEAAAGECIPVEAEEVIPPPPDAA